MGPISPIGRISPISPISPIKFLLAGFLLFLLSGCNKAGKPAGGGDTLRFTNDIVLRTTPVKDQGASSLCWVYAMLATIETEHLMQGDSVNLSADYVARNFLREQMLRSIVVSHNAHSQGGQRNLSSPLGGTEGGFTTRGTMPMLLRLIECYGLTHYDAYHARQGCNYNVLCRRLTQQARVVGSPLRMIHDADSLLDSHIGPKPLHVFMLGCEYTPRQFAHSVCRRDEYQMLTSYAHHPFGEAFPLELADNRYHDTFLNLPIDSLMARLDRSLRQGHPVCWEGDVSEKGFSQQRGTAHLQDDRHAASDAERLRSMLSGKTTDDHCMAIVGMAHDQHGRKYYLMKNSWGTTGRYRGFIYVSENYLRLKTVALAIRQEDA